MFAKNAILSKIMFQSKDLFWLIQALYISKHISRNGGATIKASRKTAHDKVFLFWGKKGIFSQNMAEPLKKIGISHAGTPQPDRDLNVETLLVKL